MHALTDRPTSSFTAVLADVSGLSLSNFFAEPGYPHSRSYTSMGFNHLPENACADKVDPTGPLHPRTYLLLFYRADALAALHAAGVAAAAAPPDDWDAMLALLQAHAKQVASAGTGTASSLPAHGLCLTVDPNCGRLGDVLAAIAASVLQSGGTQQGYVFDLTPAPPSAVPLVNSTGWRYAADVLRRMLAYNAPDGSSNSSSSSEADAGSCWGVHPAFLAGQCLMTLEWDAALTSMAVPGLQRAGALGVAPLPGSRTVVDRAAGAADGGGGGVLVPCSAELCAVSANHDLLYLRAGNGGPSSSAESINYDELSTTEETVGFFSTVAAIEEKAVASGQAAALGAEPPFLNRAPYSAAYDIVLGISYIGVDFKDDTIANLAAMQQGTLFAVSAYRDARQNFTNELRKLQGFSARLTGDAQNCSGYLGTRWWEALAASGGRGPDVRPLAAAAGLADTAAAAAYLRALWHAIHHPNAAPDVASPVLVNWYKYALAHAAALLATDKNDTNNVTAEPVDAAIALLTRLFEAADEAFSDASARNTYAKSMSALPWTSPQSRVGGKTDALGSGEIVALASVAAACVCLAAVLAVVLVLHRRRRRRHRDMLGRVLAPRANPDTTLLITDVQNSTVLWEQLPVPVMDATLKLHHGTIRRVLAKYDGYESATEGDSFIVAFADPASAVAFAAACQVSLLLEDWPPQLLAHPDAAVALVAPEDVGEGRAAGDVGLPAACLGSPMSISSPFAALPLASRRQPSSTLPPRYRGPASGHQVSILRHMLEAFGSLESDTDVSGHNGSGSAGGGGSGPLPAFSPPRSRPPPNSNAPRQAPSPLSRLLDVVEQHSATSSRCNSVGPASQPLDNSLGAPPAPLVPPRGPDHQPDHQPGPHAESALAAVPSLPSAYLLPEGQPSSGRHITFRFPLADSASQLAAPAPSRLGQDVLGAPVSDDLTPEARGAAAAGQVPALSPVRTAMVRGQAGGALPQHVPRRSSFLGQRSNNGHGGVSTRRTTSPGTSLRSRNRLMGFWSRTNVDLPLGERAGSATSGHNSGPEGGQGAPDLDNASCVLAVTTAAQAQTRSSLATWADALAVCFPSHCDPCGAAGGTVPGELSQVLWDEKRAAVTASLPGGRVGLVAYRGLRVRMGMHTGLDDPRHVAFNKVGSAFKYYGPFAETAKLVSDAAPGGLVTLSDRAFARLRNSMARGTSAASKAAREAVVVYAGRHVLAEGGQVPRPTEPTAPNPAGPPTVAVTLADPRAKATQDTPSLRSPASRHQLRHGLTAGAGCSVTGTTNADLDGAVGDLLFTMQSFITDVMDPEAPPSLQPAAAAPSAPPACRGRASLRTEEPGSQESQSVYVAVPSCLVCRLALSPPLRSLRVCELGSLAAPIGCLTVAFMKVVGASTLLADLPGPASRALDQFARLACGLLGAGGGYLVEGGDGLLLAAFGEAAGAVEWALDCVAGLKGLVWEEELLAHELCAEELAVCAAFGSCTSSVDARPTREVVQRRQSALQYGLRIKVGLARGHASHMLTEASGRLSYRGRVMNRAARIAGIAAAGQVLCSGAVWEACGQAPGFGQRVRGASLGCMNLKGISSPIDVVQCFRE